ncbi:MAG TPA: LPS export ABC transporter periplasmic protein LptC [Candidatus Competibacteraceae bacterium]|nr:LPS export ABC transporter periplasmic protein LptC [Candidatus Competibacteraceae bacterium]HQC71783.1 LPS export ABC transporter periplasmic protein LptC [Candidatus Competibacteraceae bacterium]
MKSPPGVTPRGVLLLVGLTVLAGASYGLLRWVESALRPPAEAQSQAPLLVVERFRAVRLNMTGQREYVIEAPRLEQLPSEQGTRIVQPMLDWYRPDGQTRQWRLQAEQGWVAADQSLLRLDGAVTVERLASSGQTPVTLNTRDVLVHPGERYAETAAPAQALTPGGELRSIGVRAWFDQERLELLSEVRGIYVPPKP